VQDIISISSVGTRLNQPILVWHGYAYISQISIIALSELFERVVPFTDPAHHRIASFLVALLSLDLKKERCES
jgi:hypothetical protein